VRPDPLILSLARRSAPSGVVGDLLPSWHSLRPIVVISSDLPGANEVLDCALGEGADRRTLAGEGGRIRGQVVTRQVLILKAQIKCGFGISQV
jgi:hypothetical protein